ncbi:MULTISPECIES: sigma 54-interacting transcriptional regulator [Sorangium]|uniref:Fis family transcriptional regulator n=1 Tax=Sorangium cellulosum TaxID=56 RepID=A0A4P2QLP1_SORCE|nr:MULTISPECIES: sigma 54-interacting transcriptional regulator [Sorangium]AUX30900.1 Fis family transcriptional regulator [Sorangium cellulosum]WCQ90281.1 Sigma54-dependent transcriptional activator SfnR [Sorangium sp. Soce836]
MRLLTLPTPESTTAPTERATALAFEDRRSHQLLQRVKQAAAGDAAVLLAGETGTGKEILARYVHELGARRSRPFIAVSCAALSPALAESAIFGVEQGSGARGPAPKRSLVEAAEGGTLYLDEIGYLPLGAQAGLLRLVQDREVVRLGARQPAPADVRVIAATSVPLEDMVAVGRFREDLLSRWSGAAIAVPALRERPGDILPLARHFVAVYGRRLGPAPCVLASSAMERLLAHPWPGNIRELEHVIQKALLVCRAGRVTGNDLRLASLPPKAPPPALPGVSSGVDAWMATLESAITALFEGDLPNVHERVEEIVIRAAYRRCERNLGHTANRLGVSRDLVRARLLQSGELAAPPASESPATPSRAGEARAAVRELLAPEP